MKVSRSKTEYPCINEGNDQTTVKMEDTKVPRVKKFKYLESTVQESCGCDREIKKRVQAGWNGWRRVSGVICDGKLPARVKGKVYSSVVRPAMSFLITPIANLNIFISATSISSTCFFVTATVLSLWTLWTMDYGDGSRRDENVEVCYGSDEKRQDLKRVHQEYR